MSDNDFPQRFADALVTEIKAEMGRQSLSSRALGRAIGKSSQYMSDRLDGGSPKTGKRVVLNVADLYSIANALHLTELELIERAQAAARRAHLRPVSVGGGHEADLDAHRSDYDLVANDSIDEAYDVPDSDFDNA